MSLYKSKKKHHCQWNAAENWGHAGGFDFDLERCSVCGCFRVEVYHSSEAHGVIAINRLWVKRIRQCASPKQRQKLLLQWFEQR